MSTMPTVRILGTHGVPAAYGGFETAAENVAGYLRSQGWRVIVYCQREGRGAISEDTWHGLERVNIPEHRPSWRGTSSYDLKSIRHALANYEPGEVWLTFGYNTAVFDILPRLKKIPLVINMDGMEWTRAKWGLPQKAILLANERIAGIIGTTLVADHPHIARYLRRHFGARRVTTITYGAPAIASADPAPVHNLGLTEGAYAMVVCRPIPENSVVEIVSAWSARKRGMPLVVVGPFNDPYPYSEEVRAAASDEVIFPGAIFDEAVLSSLRSHSALYLHGHTVGGTNPSLVEALGAGNPVLAQRNVYNEWVAGPQQAYFDGAEDLASTLDKLLSHQERLEAMSVAARERHRDEFTWEQITAEYEDALLRAVNREVPVRTPAHVPFVRTATRRPLLRRSSGRLGVRGEARVEPASSRRVNR